MVDFNDGNTMTRPRKDVVNMMILQQWQKLLDAYCIWEQNLDKGRSKGIVELTGEIKTMITLLRTPINNRIASQKEKSPYQSISDMRNILIKSEDSEIYSMIDYLEQFLYDKGVTKWDTKEQFDRTNIAEMNRRFLG